MRRQCDGVGQAASQIDTALSDVRLNFVIDLATMRRTQNHPCFGSSSIRTPRERVKMRKTLWIMVAAMAVAVAAPYAHADSYTDATFNFTVTNGSPSPTGSFVFDDTTGTYTSFVVNWDGATFQPLSPPASAGILGSSGTWCTARDDARTEFPRTNPARAGSLGIGCRAKTYRSGPSAG